MSMAFERAYHLRRKAALTGLCLTGDFIFWFYYYSRMYALLSFDRFIPMVLTKDE
jgi:hypothetical protein